MNAPKMMTADEVALIRELVKWARNHGAEHIYWCATLRLADGRTIAWETLGARQWPRAGEIGVSPDKNRPHDWHKVETVTQAVDVLVALDYLPTRFSSAYRAGWEACQVWNGTRTPDDDEQSLKFQQLFHDPDNISFPAVAPKW